MPDRNEIRRYRYIEKVLFYAAFFKFILKILNLPCSGGGSRGQVHFNFAPTDPPVCLKYLRVSLGIGVDTGMATIRQPEKA